MPKQHWYAQEPFAGLSASTRRKLQAVAKEQRIRRGECLFREAEPATALWLVRSGWVQLKRKAGNRQELTLDIVTPKDNLCGLSAFFGGRYMGTAVAATPLEAVRIPAAALRTVIGSDVRLTTRIAQLTLARYRHITSAYANAFSSAQHRIAAVLLRLEEDFGRLLPVTRKEVAELSGTTVETAIRVTRQMERKGALRSSRGQIKLLKLAALKEKVRAS